MVSYHLTTLLLILGFVGGAVSLIWLNWSVGVLALVSVGVLYWVREAVLLLEDLRDVLEKERG
ncbi:hypothetical protein Ocepr_2340 (plasmid) [Oceanithermus profundus DSM 14977]|uniref:Uncharacterized protein n=1 Tax=Oceanithermus profundus (strain DSM 14977 / NBRC 100410 / VKM B-2274 / 506) TaxID=670487 RepID=E4UAK9_OCEP5|nr:hypothetical protein [Oceanithermus profundus]ADR37788.1 hypothetical protein Ocepr_2340 [Oceanithermus profundus DSM 14977]